MRKLFTILLMLIAVMGKAQPSILDPDPHARKVGRIIILIDSIKDVRNNYLRCIDTKDIANLRVVGDNIDNGGTMYVTMKDPNIMKSLMQDQQLSLLDILKAHVKPTEVKSPVLYFLDDKLLTDTTGIRIPAKKVYTVTVIRAEETAYFKTAFPGMLIVTIETTPPKVYIRGGDADLPKKLPPLKDSN